MAPTAMDKLIEALGDEIYDPEEESFLLFSQQIPSQNLGFIDPKAQILEISIAGRDYTIHQSPGLLSSDRKEGTTGAVVWKITPLLAEWIAANLNLLARCGVLQGQACALELGCGVSGLVSLALAPSIRKYVNTDQDYVLKYLRQNIEENHSRTATSSVQRKGKKKAPSRHENMKADVNGQMGNIVMRPLDWETSSHTNLYQDLEISHLDLLISCDCIYNDMLIEPLVSTMAEICRLAASNEKPDVPSPSPTICIVAQQLRSPEVFESWLRRFHQSFHVWRVPDGELIEGLMEGSGFVVHIGILK